MSVEPFEERSLDAFYGQGLIADVLGSVKSGKEATVYRCQAARSTGRELLAAKVYRQLRFRAFRDDAVYQEGRAILDARLRRHFPLEHIFAAFERR
jgi:serine/threonine-protein kinase RIO1